MKTLMRATAIAAGLACAAPAMAADLGGNCCADLEERVAELEATAARKGNRKVSLSVYGQVNAGVLWTDVDLGPDIGDTTITQSGVDPSLIGFRGEGKIRPGWVGGFVIEIDLRQLDIVNSGVFGNATPRVRQSAVYLTTPVGRFTVGKTGQATEGFDEIDLSQTGVVARTLSLQPVADTYLTGVDLPWWDGEYQNVVRYDSPSLAGFVVSASWGSAAGGGENWDVALRYAGEFGGIQIAAGLGYRHDEDISVDVLDITSVKIPKIPLGEADRNVILVSGSLRHTPSGLFLTGEYGDQDWSGVDIRGWHIKGGIEPKLVDIGRTSFYGEYADQEVDFGPGNKLGLTMWGVGIVQAVDPAAMHLYAAYRVYDVEGEDISHVMAGARIRF